MANVSAPVPTSIEVVSPFDFTFEMKVHSGDQIYQGSGVVIGSDGLLTYATKSSATFTAGRAEQTILGDGTLTCRVRAGIFLFKNAGSATVTLAGRFGPCYWSAADTVHTTNTDLLAGLVWDVTADGVYILMGPGIRA